MESDRYYSIVSGQAGMQRREFITLLGSVVAWPLIASAQQSERVRRIGVLLGSYTESDKAGQARIAAFLKALADLGWNADRNIRIEYRWGAGDTEQTTKLILETVQSAPDAIVATSDPVLAQLHRLTSTLPSYSLRFPSRLKPASSQALRGRAEILRGSKISSRR